MTFFLNDFLMSIALFCTMFLAFFPNQRSRLGTRSCSYFILPRTSMVIKSFFFFQNTERGWEKNFRPLRHVIVNLQLICVIVNLQCELNVDVPWFVWIDTSSKGGYFCLNLIFCCWVIQGAHQTTTTVIKLLLAFRVWDWPFHEEWWSCIVLWKQE